MFSFVEATNYLREFPENLIQNKKADALCDTANEAIKTYHNELKTHTQLQNYVNDVATLVEAMAGYYHQILVPYYREVQEEKSADLCMDETGAAGGTSVDETFINTVLDCLILFCADTVKEDEEISLACQGRRQSVRKAVHESLFSQMVVSMIRRGVSSSADKLRADCVEKCAILTRVLGDLDNESWLKCARVAAECIECPRIRESGVTALGVLCQNKLKLGNKTTALKVTHEISLAVAALIDVVNDTDEYRSSTVLTNSRYAISAILQLLSDPDRAPEDSVDFPTFLGQLLDCRFTSDDDDDMFAGFCFLNLLHVSARDEFLTYVSASGLVLRALPLVMKTEHRAQRVRVESTAFLMNCADFPLLREPLLKAEVIDLLTPIVTTEIPTEDRELQAAVLAVMSKLMLHSKETNELIGDTIPMWETFNSLAEHVEQHSNTTNKAMQYSVKSTADFLVVVLSSLSFNAEFKAHVLSKSMDEVTNIEQQYTGGAEGDGGNQDFPLVRPNTQLSGLIAQLNTNSDSHQDLLKIFTLLSSLCDENKGRFHIVMTIYNMLRSATDTRPLKTGKNTPDFDDQQLKELRALYEKLPETAKVKERLTYNSGGLVISSAVRQRFLAAKSLLPLLARLTTADKRCPPSLVIMASQCVRCLSSLVEYRPQLVAQGGLQILLRALELDKSDVFAQFTVASILAGMRPESLSYTVRMSCTHQLLELAENAKEELYVHFAMRALVNLTSAFEDVCLKIFDHGKGWARIENVMTDWSDSTSAFASEVLCNICAQSQIQLTIAQLIDSQRMPWTFTLIFAYAADDSVPARQSACLSVVCYLTMVNTISLWIATGLSELAFNNEKVKTSEKIFELWLNFCATENDAVRMRLSVIACNLFTFALHESWAEGCKYTKELKDFCMKFMLSVGIVWNQIGDVSRKSIKSALSSEEYCDKDIKVLQELLSKCPDPEIRRLWSSFVPQLK